MSEHWPVYLQEGELLLRPLRIRDRRSWLRVRAENKDWLTEWEATLPRFQVRKTQPNFLHLARWLIGIAAKDATGVLIHSQYG